MLTTIVITLYALAALTVFAGLAAWDEPRAGSKTATAKYFAVAALILGAAGALQLAAQQIGA